jgi:RimJ/RimL family protein N-acetyltransferase
LPAEGIISFLFILFLQPAWAANPYCQTLLTARQLQLRPIERSDLADFERIAPAATVESSEASSHEVIESTRRVFERQIEPGGIAFSFLTAKLYHDLIFTMRLGQETLGFLGVQKDRSLLEKLVGPQPDRVAERWLFLWIALDPKFEGRGYAQEALRTFLRFVLKTLAPDGLIWNFEEKNIKSARLAERLKLERHRTADGSPFFLITYDQMKALYGK